MPLFQEEKKQNHEQLKEQVKLLRYAERDELNTQKRTDAINAENEVLAQHKEACERMRKENEANKKKLSAARRAAVESQNKNKTLRYKVACLQQRLPKKETR